MKINATDADDPTTPNAKIAFKIVQDASQPLPFHINKATGEVTAWLSLDREVNYNLILILSRSANAVSISLPLLFHHPLH